MILLNVEETTLPDIFNKVMDTFVDEGIIEPEQKPALNRMLQLTWGGYVHSKITIKATAM